MDKMAKVESHAGNTNLLALKKLLLLPFFRHKNQFLKDEFTEMVATQ